MGTEVKWAVVYTVPEEFEDWYYGVTSQEAMEALKDNGPFGAEPLYAYQEDYPDVLYKYEG